MAPKVGIQKETLPNTGETSNTLVWLGGALAALASSLYLFKQHRQREEEWFYANTIVFGTPIRFIYHGLRKFRTVVNRKRSKIWTAPQKLEVNSNFWGAFLVRSRHKDKIEIYRLQWYEGVGSIFCFINTSLNVIREFVGHSEDGKEIVKIYLHVIQKGKRKIEQAMLDLAEIIIWFILIS